MQAGSRPVPDVPGRSIIGVTRAHARGTPIMGNPAHPALPADRQVPGPRE